MVPQDNSWLVIDRPGGRPEDLHVVPDFPGEREHELTFGCWCQPARDRYVPSVVIHNRMAQA